ncbi:MAG: hypothetical protein ACRDZ5_12480, partial [Acidimicrobiales bacterium]
MAGLIAHRRSPKRPHKVNEKTARRIRALRAQGKSRREIATAVGLSTYPVRQALGLGGAGRASAPEPDGEEADEEADEAREAGGCDAEEGEPGDAGKAAGAEVDPERAAATSLLPVPLPAPRAAERSLARFGLLGEAAPLFTEGAGLSRLGAAHPADHPNGFVVLVGGSAKARKGPSWDHVARLVDRASPGFSLRCATGLSSGEGLVWARRDPDGATPGSLEPPLFVVEPELASILKAAGRDRSSLSPVRARRGTDGRPLALLTPNA